jgi:hypoxanthine-DNA glycosylase
MDTPVLVHPFPPLYDADSEVLILGSFPSVVSREQSFYYANPSNRFWRVLPLITGGECGETKEEKTRFLLENNIALWDVIASCTAVGSADLSIKDAVPNDISKITDAADIKAVYLNGRLAAKLYGKYIKSDIPHFYLPSTSPANAAYSLERLVSEWSVICCNP